MLVLSVTSEAEHQTKDRRPNIKSSEEILLPGKDQKVDYSLRSSPKAHDTLIWPTKKQTRLH